MEPIKLIMYQLAEVRLHDERERESDLVAIVSHIFINTTIKQE
jgi:hypothetical protein